MNAPNRILLALTLALCSLLVSARTLDEIKTAGTIVIGIDGTFPPFQFFEGPKLKGFEIDLGEEIGKRLGVVEWKPVAFDSVLAAPAWDILAMEGAR
jgi:polar amino acid transport system substrate-binding protein